jgi:hypothetical protein
MWRLEYSGGKAFTWAIAPRSEILVTNPSDHTEQATLEVMLDRLGGSPAEVTVSYPPGKQARYPTPSAVRLSLELPPGTHVIRFAVDAPLIPGRQGEQAHYIRLAGLAVTDRRISPFLEAHGRR